MSKPIAVNIIGAGRLAKAIGFLLAQVGIANIVSVCNRSLQNAQAAVEFIGQGIACESFKELPPATVYLIATSDTAIAATAQRLLAEHTCPPNSIILHCSGALSSLELHGGQGQHFVASIHPIYSFADPQIAITQFPGTYCAYEGDEPACEMAVTLFSAIGGKPFAIAREHKIQYHAACVIACNYLVTLAHRANQLLQTAGVADEIAKPLVTHLMQGTLQNIKQSTKIEQALTGPIARGDINIIQQHLATFCDQPMTKSLYQTLGLATLQLTNLSPEKIQELSAILQK
jgi:predicted short-subunit dehydrogenase-like oxidoreductase (DUF2520 family)